MKEKIFVLFLALCLPVACFAGGGPKFRFPRGKKSSKTATTRAVSVPQVGKRGIINKATQAATHARTEGAVTRGMQQGVWRHLEVPTLNIRIPARRSNPAFEVRRILNERIESAKLFKNDISEAKMFGGELSFSSAFELGKIDGTRQRKAANDLWAEKDKIPEHKFYFYNLMMHFYTRSHFTAAQLRDIRAFYEKTISNPEIFTQDLAFADGLSSFIGISFVGDSYLAEKIASLAKAAPEGKRFLTDFVVVRSLLNLERYDLVQELMDFRQVQEGWFRDGKLITEGETACVYEEIKLYQQTKKAIPVTFAEPLPAQHKIVFSQADRAVIDLMEAESCDGIGLCRVSARNPLLEAEYPHEDPIYALEWFLGYKHKDITK